MFRKDFYLNIIFQNSLLLNEADLKIILEELKIKNVASLDVTSIVSG